jgi:hypothetical protein
MEHDRQLKQLLLNSAERASADFTDAVMKKVNGVPARPLNYQPLVSPRLKRLFLFTFGALIAAIFGLCLIIALTDFHVVSWVQNAAFPDINYNKILIFILTFWIVFTVNTLLENKFLFRKQSHFKIR